MKPFRFGVNLRSAPSRREWCDKARKVEDLGFSTLLVPDHLTDLIAPFPALVSAAEATTQLRVGTNVLNNDLRHPLLVAREAAATDLLSDGRLELGLGAGSVRTEYKEAGLAFDTGAVRVERLAESLSIIKKLLQGDTVSAVGQYYRIEGHKIAPLPVQQPRPPILIGGNGPRLLALAAREADIVGLSGITFRGGGAQLPDLSAWRASSVDQRIRHIRDAAGERYGSLEICPLVQRVIVTDDPRGAAEALTRRWPQLTADDILASPYVMIGAVDSIVEALQARRERWGISYYVVQEPSLDAIAPVVARLSGC